MNARNLLSPRIYYQVCCLILFLFASSASFNEFYQRTHFDEAHSRDAWFEATFEGMVNGTAYCPYVYRQLLPDIVNLLDRTTPNSIKTYLYHRLMNPSAEYPSALTTSIAAWDPNYFFRYLALYLCTYLSAFIAVWAMYLVCRALGLPMPASVFAPVVVILLVPYVMSGGGYFYDFPELAFFALTFFVALKFDWYYVIPLVLLGTWNKESFLFFVATLYPIFRQKSPRTRALLQTGILGILSAAVVLWLRWRFAANPGSTVLYWLPDEFNLLKHPRYLITANREIYGIPMPLGITIGPILMITWTVWRAWKHLPLAIKRHAQMAAVINLPLYLLFVQPGKLRDLSMLYMSLLIVIAVNLKLWMKDVGPQEGASTSPPVAGGPSIAAFNDD